MPLLLAVGLSALLAVVGFVPHRRGHFTRRGPAMIWAIVTILPLFGAGAAMFLKRAADEVTGKTQSARSAYDSRGAP